MCEKCYAIQFESDVLSFQQALLDGQPHPLRLFPDNVRQQQHEQRVALVAKQLLQQQLAHYI